MIENNRVIGHETDQIGSFEVDHNDRVMSDERLLNI